MKEELVSTLLYFDIFSYPLTQEELLLFAGIPDNHSDKALQELNSLVATGMLSYSRGFYFAGSNDALVDKRLNGNRRAKSRMRAARLYSRIISHFPFVRGVMLSGSISKGYMGKRDDIDYFIVTKPGRLWITRTLLVLFKKVFLFNSYRNFCINYFVDEDKLHIQEKNRFTATEIAFLMPVYNKDVHNKMLEANRWIKQYYPLFSQNGEYAIEKDSIVKRFLELLLDNKLGDRLDDYLLNLSRKIIQQKFDSANNTSFALSFVIKKNELRYLPNRQQHRIMNRFSWKIKIFERKWNMQMEGHELALQTADQQAV